MHRLVWSMASVQLRRALPLSTPRAANLLQDISLQVCSKELVVLIGPNGAGKSTLLRTGLGLQPLSAGTVRLNGKDPRALPPQLRAREISYLPQQRPLAWPMRVSAVVALGRFAYGAPFARLDLKDSEAVARALSVCRLESLADRPVEELSGGEQARVHIARALAAETPLFLADEPTSMLDPLHAFETLAIIKRYCQTGGGALVSLHDLSLAARFADRLVLLQNGRVLAEGSPLNVLTPKLLAEAYGVRVEVRGAEVSVLGPVE